MCFVDGAAEVCLLVDPIFAVPLVPDDRVRVDCCVRSGVHRASAPEPAPESASSPAARPSVREDRSPASIDQQEIDEQLRSLSTPCFVTSLLHDASSQNTKQLQAVCTFAHQKAIARCVRNG